ncbi:MAG: phosphate acyltransferase PlsX [Flavobacteriales bacterium]|jgi:phosphate acyltransferase|nr:phosphate acyltransferase PlsX [Flavobacteriales bacterium]|tara:strand:+ start:18588 stop:19526 length:939 start_codon:yes stop_codon:yes gene_type:complete
MRIGVDIMGGDYAPEKTIKGAILAGNELPKDTKLIFFGKQKKIELILSKQETTNLNFEIVNCDEIISMGEHAIKAFKKKPNSSIAKGFEYLSHDKIDGFASAGNTGAMFIGGYYSVKAIGGVLRPCICSVLPKVNGGVTVLLDVGANADCKADVLYQFGLIGSLYAQHVCKIEKPNVSLLNLGEEKSKGNMLTQAAYEMMFETPDYNFIGNIESRDIFDSKTDVIVCDGFTGNIVLKQAEAIYQLVKKRNIEDEYFNKFNYEIYGGTPILGLNKTVIIGHGISNEIAIKNMIIHTKDVVDANLSEKIKKNIT